jgi:hypothetical protein
VRIEFSRVAPFDFEGAASAGFTAEQAAKGSLLYRMDPLESMGTYSTDLKTGHLSSIEM